MAKWKSKGWARQEEDKVQAEAKSCQLYWLQGVGVVRFQIGWVFGSFLSFFSHKTKPTFVNLFLSRRRERSKQRPPQIIQTLI